MFVSSLNPSRSIRVRLGVIFGLFSAAVAMVLTGLLGQLGRSESEEQLRSQLMHSAAELAKSVDLGLFERFGELDILGRMLLVADDQWDNDAQRKLLDEFQRVNPRYTWIGIIDLNGTIRIGGDGMREGENVAKKECFQRGLQGPFVGEMQDTGTVRRDGRRVWELEVAIPLRGHDEEIIAVLGASISWDWLNGRYEVLSSTLQEVRKLEVLVLDRDGRIILAPAESGLENQRFSVTELMDPERQEQQYVYGAAVCNGLRHFAGVGWTVVLRQPEAFALEPVQRLQGQLFLAGIAGALIAGIAGWWIAGIFTKPVVALARVSQELADGPGLRASLPPMGNDEIGMLTTSLRTLLDTRERQANELRQSFRQFTSTFENAAVGIALVALDGRWYRVNEKLAETLGYSRTELAKLTYQDVTYPEDLPADLAHVQRLLDGEALHYTQEKRYIRKNGDVIWVNITVSLSKNDHGKPEHFVCVVEDITCRREAQQALRESEKRFREMADQAPVLIWTCDPWKSCTFVNRPWLTFTGRTMDKELGLGWLDNLHPEDAEFAKEFDRAFAEQRAFETECRFRRHDGEYRWLLIRGMPLFRGEQFAGYVGSNMDCTDTRKAAEDQKAAREAAESASRAKDEFLAALSHELRTPLNPVLLIASENEKNPGLPDELREDFMAIRKSIALEARLIDDLLDLTRITRGKLQLNTEPVDAHSVLHQALNLVHSDLESKQIVITLDLSSPEHRILADAVRLQQVFWNVILNAVKFTPAGGTIAVRTRPGADRSLHIEISDSGMGIAPEEMPRIFESFAQGGHSQTPHRFGGLGLGLAIAKLLIEQQSGRIWAESRGLGEGATFLIELPLAPIQSTCEPTSGTTALPQTVSGRKILLVEDHEPTRITMMRLLLHRGHEVEAAGTVATAKALAATGDFDLVISDLGLPDGSGHDLMAELHQQYGVIGIALSGYGMDDDVQRSTEVGFHRHLTKPVDIAALEEALAAATAAPPSNPRN